MIELLAAIASDPSAIPLWGVALLAAAMYPIGFMLGSDCSPCCNPDPCSCSSGSTLPETITATLNGFPDFSTKQVCTLSFSACYGSGASGTVDAPGQSSPESDPVDDRGPITAVSITSKGGGYAIFGREEPTLSVSAVDGDGVGGSFAVTLAQSKNGCGIPQWGVGTVSVAGGEGYADGDLVHVSPAAGDTVEQAAVCYIREQRLQPTLSASATGGAGAAFSITYQRSPSSPFTWAVKSVAVTSQGSGYTDGDSLSFTLGEDDVEIVPAVATISEFFGEPTLAASVAGGSGAQFSLAYAPKTSPHEGWYGVSSVAVTNGGTGYSDNASVTFTLGTDDVLRPGYLGAIATARTVLRAPNDSWTLAVFDSGFESPSPGSGLQLSIALTQFTYAGRPAWKAASATVTNGGSGYSVGDFIEATANEGVSHQLALFQVTAVGGGGAVASVSPDAGWPGRYVVDTGVIESVSITSTGVYRKESGAIGSVTVEVGGEYYKQGNGGLEVAVDDPGVYYRENPSLPPYVADVTVSVVQSAPSDGSGAVISAEVDADTSSPHFGAITGLTIENGGDGYLAWEVDSHNCCGHYLNGQQIVLKRFADSNASACESWTLNIRGQYSVGFFPEGGNGPGYFIPSDCVYTTQFCGGWEAPFLDGPIWFKEPTNSGLQLYVGYRGEGERPVAKLSVPCYGGVGGPSAYLACHHDWIADEPIESCSQFSFSATPSGKPSITVEPDGTYENEWRFYGCGEGNNGTCQSCNVCCQGDGEAPEEIEVVITDQWTTNRPPGLPNFSGTYVANGTGNYWVSTGGVGVFQVGLYPCHDGLWPIYTSPLRANCKTCIKKCRAWFGGMNFQWQHNGLTFVARIAPAQTPDDCGECEPTPFCSPAGKTFSLSKADPALVGFGEGEHAATVTIQ